MIAGQEQASQLAATQNAQNNANDQWVAYQNQIHKQQALNEDAARSKATAAQQSTLQQVSPQAQEAEQGAEQQRLNNVYNKAGASGASDSSDPNNLLLSGEKGGDAQSINSITSQINQATSQARQRIGALATANSYGGSFGGLGTVVPQQFTQGGNAINLQNAIRQGDLKTYGVQQQVQPLQYTVGPGTEQLGGIAKALGSVAGSLAGAAGPQAIGNVGGLSGIFGGGGAVGGSLANADWGAAAGDLF